MVRAAMVKELRAWVDNMVFRVVHRKDVGNPIDCRWVIRWRMIDGKKAAKARLVLRAFKDRSRGTLSTSSPTASRVSQRTVCSVAVQMNWEMLIMDF
eukprot:1615835-Heterocapsa_arctica.AAC.1